MVAHPRRHRAGAIPDIDGQQQFPLGVHRHPHPTGRPLPALDGFTLTAPTLLDRAAERQQLIELYLPDLHGMQEVLGEGSQLLRRGDPPLQPRVWVDLEYARRASDA